jgi:hypothetical protein
VILSTKGSRSRQKEKELRSEGPMAETEKKDQGTSGWGPLEREGKKQPRVVKDGLIGTKKALEGPGEVSVGEDQI